MSSDSSLEVYTQALVRLVLYVHTGRPLNARGSFRDLLKTTAAAEPEEKLTLEGHMAGTFAHLAQQVAARPEMPIDQLELVTEEERELLLGKFAAGTGCGSPGGIGAETTIVDMFADCVKRFPNYPAITFQGTSSTYAELDRRAGALALLLVRQGIKADEVVAILLGPSLEMVVAMLGVLRAGACYLPIDSDLPIDRIRYLLDDSGAKFLIGGPRGIFSGRQIDPADLAGAAGEAGEAGVFFPRVCAGDAAYLIYTSGTTGKPKGVLIEHHSVVNYVSSFREQYGVDASHTAALLTSYAYDLGYTTLWTAILSGAHLHLLPKSLCQDAGAVARYFREHGISFIKVTPSLLSALLVSHEFGAGLRLIVSGGENVRPADIETIYARCPDSLAVNHYGPTETTIGAMTYPIDRTRLGELAARSVIGRPIRNVYAYITTSSGQLLPVGAPGELWIGGRGVGRGYHQRDELTREKFIPDRFSGSGRIYRTGDLARWTPEGTLEFLGRIDRQVKIRGYRVELAEIEHVMRRRLALREVVVLDRVVGRTALCAYYVADQELDPAEICRSLSQILPEYMVPAHFIRLLSLPRTPNGKLDTEKLPEPTLEPAEQPKDRPRTETERILAKIWSDTLGVALDALGISQNFFELGGHSLLMIQIIAEIDNHFGRTVELPVFYGEGTIRALAEALDTAGGVE